MLPDQGAPTRGEEVERDSVMLMRFVNRSEQMPRMMVVRWRDVISKLRTAGSREKERARVFTTTQPLKTLGFVVSKAASATGNCRNHTSTCAVTRVVDLSCLLLLWRMTLQALLRRFPPLVFQVARRMNGLQTACSSKETEGPYSFFLVFSSVC